MSIKSNYGLRHILREHLRQGNLKTTAITCCGANPGMVSWFVKKGLLDIAVDTGFNLEKEPKTREEWAELMMNLGVKGVHIAERDTQITNLKRPVG